MDLKPIIGLEIHVQLKTKSKMFCRCKNDPDGREPNVNTCPICMGFPGVLPVANKQALEWTIKTALALHCEIAPVSTFARKHYFYPDLPKNYQITQYDEPLAKNGWFILGEDGHEHKIRIRRVHLEEDAGKLLHPEGDFSLVDLNRTGTPLMEIVTEPDFTSPAQVKIFLQELQKIMRYLKVSDADMEKGQLRCDANVNLELVDKKRTPIVEIKNMNSFRSVERALKYEIERQIELFLKGRVVARETRGWLDDAQKTQSLRGKEEVEDYRYFPEPDLPPILPNKLFNIAKMSQGLPEMPSAKKKRFLEMGFPEVIAETVTVEPGMSMLFEKGFPYLGNAKQRRFYGNLIVSYYLGLISQKQTSLDERDFVNFAKAARDIEEGVYPDHLARTYYPQMFKSKKPLSQIIKSEGIKEILDRELNKIVEQVIEENPKPVGDYKAGKEEALRFLVGKVMARTSGRANPQKVINILQQKLN